jgi:pilus assembly protein CpaF
VVSAPFSPRRGQLTADAIVAPSTNGAAAPSTHELLRLRVQDRLRRDGAEDSSVSRTGTRDATVVRAAIREVVDSYQREADRGIGDAGRLSHPAETIARLERSLLQAGPLTKYFVDPERAADLFVNGDVITAVGRDGRLSVDPEPTCQAELTAIITRLLAEAGATVDLEHTIEVHQIWDNQVRASVSIPPTAERLDCAFRIYRKQRTTFDDLMEWGSLTPPAANVCKGFARGKVRALIAGEPGSGKSTFMSGWIAATPETTNVRISQKYRELTTDQHLGGNWLAGPANKSLRDLTQAQLNFGPGLVVMTEVLGGEAFDLIRASNSGCAFITSVHSFSATEAMNALPVAAKQAVNDPVEELRRTFARLIDVVVYCEALPVHLVGESGRLRQVMEIACVPPQLSDDEFVLEPLFKREELGAPLEYRGPQALTAEFERRVNRALPKGVTVRDLCEGRAILS